MKYTDISEADMKRYKKEQDIELDLDNEDDDEDYDFDQAEGNEAVSAG